MKEVFCTRPLKQSFIDIAKDNGIKITTQRFIKIVPVVSDNLSTSIYNELNHPLSTLLFTSKNAAAAFIEKYAKKTGKEISSSWKFFCLSGATKTILLQFFQTDQIIAEGEDANALIKAIEPSEYTQPIHFFCGNRRRNALPDFFKRNNIAFKEWIIYRTENVLCSIKKDYQAYLFYSPSAVESFFSQNNLQENAACFAIGNTTATAIKRETGNDIYISKFPDTIHMLQALFNYFKIKE